MKKKYLFGLLFIMALGLVSAAWLFSIDGSTTVGVAGLGGYHVMSISIPQIDINTSEGADITTVYSEGFVINRDMNMNVTIDETFQDDSGGNCTDGINDCTTQYMIINDSLGHSEIFDGEVIGLQASSSDKNISIEVSCMAYSCPQTKGIDISLVEI